jgi:hypothetical protein
MLPTRGDIRADKSEGARERERERERGLGDTLKKLGSGGVLYCGDFSLS